MQILRTMEGGADARTAAGGGGAAAEGWRAAADDDGSPGSALRFLPMRYEVDIEQCWLVGHGCAAGEFVSGAALHEMVLCACACACARAAE